MKFRGKILVVSLSLISFSCGTETSVEGGAETLIDPYGDPPGYSGDPFAGYGPVTSIDLPAQGESHETVLPTGSWTVQVAACATLESAMSVRDAVDVSFEEPVFIDHIGSYYKVRVGSFGSSEETAELRNRLRAEGFPDAWSIERESTP